MAEAKTPQESVAARKVRQGVVVSDARDRTITVRVDTSRRHPIYGKTVRSSSKLHAPDEQNPAGGGEGVRGGPDDLAIGVGGGFPGSLWENQPANDAPTGGGASDQINRWKSEIVFSFVVGRWGQRSIPFGLGSRVKGSAHPPTALFS